MTETTQKTQILITDIPHQEFDNGWPQTLQKQLFDEKFPHLKKHCQYYTPLAFLHRVVIIFDQEDATLAVHSFLVQDLASKPVKVYLTESLLSRSRSKSEDSTKNSEDIEFHTFKRPQLSLDTQGSQGISVALSPERADTHSPTAMKFPNDGKVHYYQEPLPKPESPEKQDTTPGSTKLLYQPHLTLNTAYTGHSSDSISSVPVSPSITLDEFST
ncbi:LANO_0H14840g1_1 [Lachancea nothofagi CBS 11611]|uniref:LANO_0H14840g1_1 n=1 Tax=Lachancea nothofagi CBS 11611 TaxID=1266666 RepID=A0A1G4KMP1_9SACH|nr:LANO_0H14840g1_1 [Lachancea nothofagi CBS 11611]